MQSERARLLIVDDSEPIVWSLASFLGREYDVVPLVSPREALRRIVAGERFDVIVCDMTMPDLGGIEFFAQTRAIDPAQSEAIIFMTGLITAEARVFFASVPNVHLEKPFSAHELRALVRGRLAGHSPLLPKDL